MKKHLFFIMFLVILLASCLSDNSDNTPNIITKNSEVFVYCNNHTPITRSNTIYQKTNELGYSIPNNGLYDVWYYIRIDNNIPGESEISFANQYFPQTKKEKSVIDDLNHGLIKSDAAWNMSISKNFPLYLYDADGSDINEIIVSEPTLENLVQANQNNNYDFSGYLENKDKLHFIWYTCKQQANDHIWHIDGILTSKDRTNISQTIYGSNIEIDIHQQKHKDWNEIKTSIHLRDTVDVEVIIPIESKFLCESDDFDIRFADLYEYIENLKSSLTIGDKKYDFITKIEHKSDGIHILIKANKEALQAARKEYDDGITFEIHSYVKNSVTIESIWNKLRQSTYKTNLSTNILNGQIHSAYFEEIIKL